MKAMGRNRVKFCPDCDQAVSASSVICSCGGTVVSKKNLNKEVNRSSDLKRRRTERTKREKPNFYDALEVSKQAKKERKKRAASSKQIEINSGCESAPLPNRMHLNVTKAPPINEPLQVKEEELEKIVLSEETIAKFSLILDEINKKIHASSWQGYL